MLRFRRSDRSGARAQLEIIAKLPKGAEVPWLLVGQLEQALGDDAAADRALVRHLEDAPRDLPALLLLGGLRARRGDDRAAGTFYQAALNVAAQPGFNPPAALHPMLREAQTFQIAATKRFQEHLEAAIADDLPAAGGRIKTALDLLLGRSELYLQQPSMFYFPGLPQRPFFEREEFGWLSEVEAAAPIMRRELAALLTDGDGFAPYVQRSPDRPPPANRLLDDPSWSAQYLWQAGAPAEPAASRCPATMATLARAPIPVIARRSPMALFSVLQPGAHIQPHHGLLNTRLICHLPLIVPDGCALRVGAETRAWEEGRALIFDDSFEHEASNRGTSTRVVLLFEIWRPEIGPDERRALTTIFEAIDTYRGAAVDAG